MTKGLAHKACVDFILNASRAPISYYSNVYEWFHSFLSFPVNVGPFHGGFIHSHQMLWQFQNILMAHELNHTA